jgi:hypothetical protein
MKYPLIARVPDIWRRLDTNDVSRKFFGVIDEELDRLGGETCNYLNVTNIDKIPDKFLSLLCDLTGHVWRHDKTVEWNRDRIRFGLKRASYKGTTLSIKDLAIENGSIVNQIQDNASKLLILGKQGRLGCDDAYLVSSDYWHDGAFVVEFQDTGDTNEIINELPKYIPAGQVWFTNFVYVLSCVFDTDCQIIFTGTLTFTEALQGTVGFGTLGGNLLLSSEPNGRVEHNYSLINWHSFDTDGPIGTGLLGSSLYLSIEPAIAPELSYNTVGCHVLVADRSLGYAALGLDLFLSVEPATTGIRELDDYIPTPVSIGPIPMEMAEANISWSEDHYTQLTSIAFEAIEASIAKSTELSFEVARGTLEMTESDINIERLDWASVFYTLDDENITFSDTNR